MGTCSTEAHRNIWRSLVSLQPFLSLNYDHYLDSPAGKTCPLTALLSCWGSWQQKTSQQFSKSHPRSDYSWPTGITIAKSKDRYTNTTATKKLACELSQRHIHISSWVKLSGKSFGWQSEICKFTLKQQSCPSFYAVHILKITTWRIYDRVQGQLHCSICYCGNMLCVWQKLWEKYWMNFWETVY